MERVYLFAGLGYAHESNFVCCFGEPGRRSVSVGLALIIGLMSTPTQENFGLWRTKLAWPDHVRVGSGARSGLKFVGGGSGC